MSTTSCSSAKFHYYVVRAQGERRLGHFVVISRFHAPQHATSPKAYDPHGGGIALKLCSGCVDAQHGFIAFSKSQYTTAGMWTSAPSRSISDTNAHQAKHDESGRLVCQEYLADTCKQGLRCLFAHPPRYQWIKVATSMLRLKACTDATSVQYLPRNDEVCEEYIEGRCFLGENCWRRHPSQCRPTSTPILQTSSPPFVQPATAKKSDVSVASYASRLSCHTHIFQLPTLPQESSLNSEKQSSPSTVSIQ